MRREFLLYSFLVIAAIALLGMAFQWIYWTYLIVLPIIFLGFTDYFQTRQTIRRNFPILGRVRYLFEMIRPEINQYFVESNSDGVPFSREQRSIVYQRAKNVLDTLPFGTQKDVYEVGYEWINHSLQPTHVDPDKLRILVGNDQCTKPYSASLFNISAMSYGSLSKNAVMALNGGAKDGDFAHNTGEGGVSPYHLKHGGDLIWQIGTGYFGCRSKDGGFEPSKFAERSQLDSVKMIEVKVSQGAKPGHGGILPGKKVNAEIAEIRGVTVGEDVLSPPGHSAFSTPMEMMEFIARLRELSQGKPVGFKICLGKRREFFAIAKAMKKTGIYPDFIVVDGGEGGTGAAPLEFSNYLGSPGVEGLVFIHNALVGLDLRKHIRIFSTGKVVTAFDLIKRLALGADAIYSARGMMLALGCIQALRCNSNVCPAGVATTDANLYKGLHIGDKRKRVYNFHKETINSVAEMLGAMGLNSTEELRAWHIVRRTQVNTVKHYGEIFDYLKPGELLGQSIPADYSRAFEAAEAGSFAHAGVKV